MAEIDQTSDVSALTVQLLSAYLANNTVPSEALAELIRTTKAALTQEASSSAETPDAETFIPVVTARKSLASPEHIISLIDGKPYKTLKRHLASRGLTPDEYRSRYNLPASYPMVAPAYAEHRRAVAHRLGLGRKGPKADAEEQDTILPVEAQDTQLASEPATAVAAASKQPKKTAAERAPNTRKKGAASGPDSSTAVADSPIPDTNPDSGAETPASETAPKASAATAARKPKGASKKSASASGMPRATTAGKALDVSKPSMEPDTAGAVEVSSATKPSKRRGKIGLFKSANSEPVSSAKSADDLVAPTSAQAEVGPTGSNEPPSKTASKTRGSKRMAREPKSGTS